MSMLLRNAVSLRGARLDLGVAEGRIVPPDKVRARVEIDAQGCTVLPGLHDHHLHILATAAQRRSLDLSRCRSATAVHKALRDFSTCPIRATGYDERAAGLLDRDVLDRWVAEAPLRIQDRTGALWVLNSAALERIGTEQVPSGAERDASGRLTGRFWREDAWLGRYFAAELPDITSLAHELASFGLTGLTDAGWRNGPAEAKVLGEAHLAGSLPQRLVLLGDERLREGPGYRRGALKLMIDERDPPPIEVLRTRITAAREESRCVAAHCATATELALFLGALGSAGGARDGDRIEHGGVLTDAAIAAIAATPLTIVTNPAFVHDRGDRYRSTIREADWGDLYRAASVMRERIPLAAGSDAPYASADPWLAMRTARDRLTAAGEALGRDERVAPAEALQLYLGSPSAPGGPPRVLLPGTLADFIVCEGTPVDVLADLTAERVRLTVIAGEIAFSRA